ncbi:MAG: hypothetical protein IJ703_01815 [Eubacterium sp.]|nr:hypothetical protein [Eubacterium sp.]
MGSGFHGGFGATKGSRNSKVVIADATLVGNGRGHELKEVSKRVKKEPGYTDVAVHGDIDKILVYIKDGNTEKEIVLNHRNLARYLKRNDGYTGGKIRLLSCKTGSEEGSFAQDLANKLGVVVRAPSDTLHIFPSGRMVIGPDMFTDTGRWIDYYPRGKKR